MTNTPTKIEKIRAALEGATPGPRAVSPTDDTTVICPDRSVVAEVYGDYNHPDLWPIMEANARLIALAPDMARIVLAAEKLAAIFEDRLVLWEAGDGDEEAWRVLSEYRAAVEG